MKKLRYIWLLWLLATILTHFPTRSYAVEEDDATSKAGIRFVDRRGPMEDISTTNEENDRIGKSEKDFPKTNEKPTVYLSIIGLIAVGCVLGWIGYKKMVK